MQMVNKRKNLYKKKRILGTKWLVKTKSHYVMIKELFQQDKSEYTYGKY